MPDSIPEGWWLQKFTVVQDQWIYCTLYYCITSLPVYLNTVHGQCTTIVLDTSNIVYCLLLLMVARYSVVQNAAEDDDDDASKCTLPGVTKSPQNADATHYQRRSLPNRRTQMLPKCQRIYHHWLENKNPMISVQQMQNISLVAIFTMILFEQVLVLGYVIAAKLLAHMAGLHQSETKRIGLSKVYSEKRKKRQLRFHESHKNLINISPAFHHHYVVLKSQMMRIGQMTLQKQKIGEWKRTLKKRSQTYVTKQKRKWH